MPLITGRNSIQYEVSPMCQWVSTMAGAEPMKQAMELKFSAAAQASMMNSGWRITVSEVATRLRPLKGMRSAGGSVSGSFHQAENANTSPHSTMNANTARQPKATCAQPPTIGATAGAMLKIM